MRLEHIRYGRIGRTVLGCIALPGNQTVLTLEDFEEIIDPGFYHLEPFAGVKFKDTFALIGESVSMYPEVGVERSTCVYHGGDTHEDTSGCPLVGVKFHFNGVTPDIDGGAEAMKILRSVLRTDHTHYVNIVEEF